MDHSDAYITLSECIYRIAAATKGWREFAMAKSAIMQAALDGKLSIYGFPSSSVSQRSSKRMLSPSIV